MGWTEYALKMADHLIYKIWIHVQSIFCECKENKLSLPNGMIWETPPVLGNMMEIFLGTFMKDLFLEKSS